MSAVLARVTTTGVSRVVAVGSDLSTNLSTLHLAQQPPEVLPAFGLHPERLDVADEEVERVARRFFGIPA